MSENSDKNLSRSQVIVYCLIGFLAPICTILLVNTGSPINRYLRQPKSAALLSTASASFENTGIEPGGSLSVEGGSSFARIKGSQSLDPQADQLFLLAFKVKFDRLPNVGHRQNIIEKYEADEFPYSGWSFGVSQLGTSFRPEFYWRDQAGEGGWYTFADFEAKSNRWYYFTVLARSDQYASLFMETSGREPQFLGGVSLQKVQNPQSSSDLLLGAVREGEIAFMGDLGSVLIATPGELPGSPEELSAFIAGGPESLVQKIGKEELKLWIDSTGADRSAFKREIILSGSSSWGRTTSDSDQK